MSADPFEAVCRHARQTALVKSVESVLEWDERTQVPSAGGDYRGEQLAFLAGLQHQRATDPAYGEQLRMLADDERAADPQSDSGATIRLLLSDFEKQRKLPQDLVEELARISVLGQQAWVAARRDNDFASFAPLLERIVKLKQQQADAIGHDNCRYDALLDEFEPQESTANVARVLEGLREALVELLGDIRGSTRKTPVEILKRHYPTAAQEKLCIAAAQGIGFDFQRGRLDVTQHPFCATLGPHDIRLTTRYDEHWLPCALFGTLHEAGHGLYEQGLRPDQFGLPPGEATSLGIHESQSRLWENQVGRSRAYWDFMFADTQAAFPGALADVRLDDFYAAINHVEPSLIRVEADEATYNLHIIIRFELEQELINEELAVADLPAAWNERYEKYLGVTPPDDSDGVLQDIHWSGAAIGYFPTYALGNLYAAQLFAQADKDLGGCQPQFARGEFTPLREWLNEKVHRPGRALSAAEIARSVTGKPVSHEPLIDYLRAKLAPIYGF